MATQSKVDRFPPALMLGAWLGGVIVAFGHHLYYWNLDGSPVDMHQSILGFRISSQQLSNALGTTFTFIARAFLVFATSVAYVQVFWRAARHPRKRNTLADLDTMFSGLSNVFAFGRVSAWQKHPMLLLVALTSWLLPLAFVIPPGTLSVVLVSDRRSVIQDVPNVDFTSFNYVAGMPFVGETPDGNGNLFGIYEYNGPSVGVEKVAIAVAAQGAILPIDAPAVNASWALDFYGPSLSCGAMNDSVWNQVELNIVRWLSSVSEDGLNCLLRASTYLCWNPTLLASDLYVYENRTTTLLPYVDNEFSTGSTRGPFTPLYMALLPSMAASPCNSTSNRFESASFLQCDLHNASYHVDFSYESGVQNITAKIDRLEAVANVYGVFGPEFDPSSRTCDQLVEDQPHLVQSSCVFDTGLLRRLSYTGILDAFRQLVTGSVSIDRGGSAVIDTNMFATSLIDTPELEYLLESVKSARTSWTIQTQFTLVNTSQGGALSNFEETPPRSSLPHVIEEMFTNLTLSLMSSNLLQPNLASAFSPPPVEVTFATLKPVYSYSPAQLWIAYGAAILAASLTLVVGIVALVSNGASYNGDFSSILRAAYGAVLSFSIQRQDAHGAAPLPKYLESAKVSWITPGDCDTKPQPQSGAEDEDSQGENLVNHYERDPDQNAPSSVYENAGQVGGEVEHSDPTAVSREGEARSSYGY
ncbi:hypothetical protein F5B21DRAFT_508512 [Xylaria acuta]|nr:hypothetical protein F5B21DRAFT_508512 [Xylaria acuta]